MNRYDFAVYIGRFQPFHDGHLACLTQALDHASKLIVLVGSINRPRNIRDPFSYAERREMIEAAIPLGLRDRVIISGVSDRLYNLPQWVTAVQAAVDGIVGAAAGGDASVILVGHRKDQTSDYLDLFPQWDLCPVEEISILSATQIRDALLGLPEADLAKTLGGQPIPNGVKTLLGDWIASHADAWRALRTEWDFIRRYRSQFEGLRYPPIFQTVDAVVIQAGHILLVERGAHPGRGLLALPGGFLNADERIEDAVIRELREETGIKVPEPVLRGSIRARARYDDPMRSLRGRTITDAFLFDLRPGPLPKIKGGSDARRAHWTSLAEFQSLEAQMFEDHFHIVQDLLGRI
ncbi:bifunctional nicotinamide-nucleotide adenylyltransferase/Nudix hydroxylase [Thiorhodococcus mannitoliphagus]|uniref:Bifunctional nicotinamide-nucleotide adenylyltransferase/Nudix hydroxylase n=1 Tax=Thiorhodococcus mannitoliphagus TaxID=329406 RepID=A0A6P1DLH6_9GAMM|nr:bifunctional nicotinamide-nucleotide adenylyltransferase/Nudix hydroxylase [Thiorhodococcus mannitoliphagus]NEX18779.1 bifunctional nicotinamide-nucleotide adenylyltransferase/Nudix hydroxylase [Thiorhodococcus mannitoliphagus]